MFSKNNITSDRINLIEFPLLPNTNSADSRRSSKDSEIQPGSEKSSETDGDNRDTNIANETFSNVVKKSTEGKITKPPVENQYGMSGLVSIIRATRTNPNLVTLTMGVNLEELGLNLSTPDNLYTTFDGPFSDLPCRVQDVDYEVPPEYLVNTFIRDRLCGLTFTNLKDDVIFFLFYGSIGDYIQLACAAELYNRHWRFYIEERIWFTRIPGVHNYKRIGTIERGIFYYFDPRVWRRIAREFEFDSNKIEGYPNLSTIVKRS